MRGGEGIARRWKKIVNVITLILPTVDKGGREVGGKTLIHKKNTPFYPPLQRWIKKAYFFLKAFLSVCTDPLFLKVEGVC